MSAPCPRHPWKHLPWHVGQVESLPCMDSSKRSLPREPRTLDERLSFLHRSWWKICPPILLLLHLLLPPGPPPLPSKHVRPPCLCQWHELENLRRSWRR